VELQATHEKGENVIDRNRADVRAVSRWLSAVALVVALGACGRDAPLHPSDGRALPPERASRLLNPLCAGTGGTTHVAGTISTAVTWAASGNPHRVTGTVTLGAGGQLTVEPGVIVCFEPQTGLQSYGGRLVAQGLAATPIVLTARDPVLGWYGVSLQGTPSTTSYLTNARVEYATLYSTAVAAFSHPLVIDSTVVRQSGGGVRLQGRTSSFSRSRVDTTTNRDIAAVTLGDSAWFEQSVIRRAAGIGMLIEGTAGLRVLGGRIEGSGGTGIRAAHSTGNMGANSIPVRVVGGASYGIETTIAMLRRLYDVRFDHDSLKGNARDTVVILGGTLNSTLYVRNGLPWHVKAPISVVGNGRLASEGGSRMVLDPEIGITTSSGGRVTLRGTGANPVILTADDPARGWAGITLNGTPQDPSVIVNARVEHVASPYTAVVTSATHGVTLDSTVIRQTGRAVSLLSAGSRLSRSRVDTTLSSLGPAVELGADAILESTRIRGSSGDGVSIFSSTVQVQSCEVLGSVGDGMELSAAAPVHNCNLVGNLGVGVRNLAAATADATGNWWGDVGGPTAPAGDGVGGAVTYSPWLTAPYVLPYVP
jgi:predicted small lipoprotein YifL